MEKQEVVEVLELLIGTIDDFMPNIGKCVLQDYGRLNEGLIRGRKLLSELKVEGGT